jgi:hypothetical protein
MRLNAQFNWTTLQRNSDDENVTLRTSHETFNFWSVLFNNTYNC